MRFPLTDYLHRIRLESAPTADLEGLKQLHHAQFLNIPFENLDIQLGRPIRLDTRSLVEKLIYKRRGGYCFELNGLLLIALQALGFQANPLLARVHLEDPPSGLTHQVNAVQLEAGTWLVDAGFGASGPRFPLLLEDGWSQLQSGFGFRVMKSDPYGWMVQSLDPTWKNSYSVEERRVFGSDIEVANFYTSHSPQCHFTTTRTVSIPTDDGRISLHNQVLTIVRGGSSLVHELAESETFAVLAAEFGIDLEAKFSDFKSIA